MSFPGTPRFFYTQATTQPTALPALRGQSVDILNNTGSDLIFDHGLGTMSFTLPTGNAKVFHLQACTSELRVSVAAGVATVNFQGEAWG